MRVRSTYDWGTYVGNGCYSVRVQKFPAWHTKAAPNGKMLWGIYSAIYGEVNVSVEKCVEIKGDHVEK